MSDPESIDQVLHVRRFDTFVSADRQMDAETAIQLRRRLILIDLVILSAFLVFRLGMAVGLLTESGLGAAEPWYFGLMLATLAPPLLLLVSRPALRPGELRLLGRVIFGAAAAGVGVYQWLRFHNGWYEALETAARDRRLLEVVAGDLSLPWFALIMFYGICIPGSRLRALAAVAGLAALGLLTVGLIAWSDSRRPPFLAPELVRAVVPTMALWLAVGAAIAVYGAERIRALHREAAAARELGQYVLKKRLGRGGMGEVFLAEHRLLRRPCAVKLIRADQAGGADLLKRFQREVSAMARLTHPNNIQVFDYGLTDDGIFYYVMEYLRGMTAQELVDRHGPLPPERAVDVLQQVCAALQEAHARGLLHRDVKPGNVFIGERGLVFDVVKLLDFGLVRRVGGMPSVCEFTPAAAEGPWSQPLTGAGGVLGTPLYLSPEQVRGAPLDGRSDIYGLGLVAYFLLSARTPFHRDTIAATIAARLSDPVPPLLDARPGIDVDLNHVVMRCLERDPASRYLDVGQVAAALAGCSCAGRWTAAKAGEWWRLHVPEMFDRDGTLSTAEGVALPVHERPKDGRATGGERCTEKMIYPI